MHLGIGEVKENLRGSGHAWQCFLEEELSRHSMNAADPRTMTAAEHPLPPLPFKAVKASCSGRGARDWSKLANPSAYIMSIISPYIRRAR